MARAPSAAILLLGLAPLAPAAEAPRELALKAALVYTAREEIEGGTVLVRDGKIAAVGRDLPIPEGARVIDLPGRSIIPGLIDSETTLADGGDDTRRSLTPDVLAADGWDFYADRGALLRGGVTCVHVSAGSRRLLSGRGLVVKTGGHDPDVARRVLRLAAGVRVALGERPKNPPGLYDPPVEPSPDQPFRPVDLQLPSTRAGGFMALRDLLRRAGAGPEAGAIPASAWREPDPEAAALLEVAQGRDRLRIQVERAHDIERALALAAELRIGVVLEGAREAWRVADPIARSGAPVIFRGGLQPGRIGDEDVTRASAAGLHREGTAALLALAGVKLAIDSPTDGEVDDLLLEAAVAVREGLSPAAALRAITLAAAEILQVADRVGSIEPGKDADLVVLPAGRLFAAAGGSPPRPEAVFIEGELVYTSGPREVPAGATVVRAGRIFTGREEIPGGLIVVRAGKIVHVGPGTLLSPAAGGARVIDASDQVVIPGLIDAGSRLGVHIDALAPPPAEESASGGGGRTTYRLADAIDPSDPAIRLALRQGITTALIVPEPVGTISGQITALKLAGGPRSRAVLREHAGLLFAAIRGEDLDRGQKYHERWSDHERGAAGKDPRPGPPERDEALEPLRPLFAGRAPAVAFARSKGDLAGILRELSDKHRLPAAVFGPFEVDGPALDELKRRGAALLFSPGLLARRQAPPATVNLPRLASEAGVRFAFRSGASAGARQLPLEVALAVREGWDAREALRAMTLHAAQIFKLDDRVGSIEKGKDADLVFLTGDPFSLASRVVRVMVDGEIAHEEAGR